MAHQKIYVFWRMQLGDFIMNKMNRAVIHAMAVMGSAKKQKGASSLEYIMLAAVIVGILVFLNTDNSLSTSFKSFFTDLFDKVGTESGL